MDAKPIWFFRSSGPGQPGAFCRSDTHGDPQRGDAVITAKRHAALLADQDRGAAIIGDDNGRPRAVFPPAASLADRRARLVDAIKAEAARRILAIAPLWQQLNDLRSPTLEARHRGVQIDAIRHASNLIEAEVKALKADAIDGFDVRSAPLWPVFDAPGHDQEEAH